jgi:predicted ATPase
MITKLSLQNFKCFREEQFEIRNITVLAGMNGSGKSSIIQSILLYRRALEVLNLKQTEVEINGYYLLNLGEASKVIHQNAKLDENTGKALIKINVKFNSQVEDNIVFSGKEQSLSLDIESKAKPGTFKQSKFLDDYNFSYLNAERIGPRKISLMRNTRILDTGFQGEYTSFVIDECNRKNLDVHENMLLKDAFNEKFLTQVEGWVSAIISEIKLKIIPIVATGEVLLSVDDDILPPSTGFGISYALPIIVNGLLASSLKNSIMVVENPEAHLHPQGQSKMGRFLALLSLSGVQVILETHSEHVLNGIRLELAANKQSEKGIIYFFSSEKEESSFQKTTKVKQILIKPNGELSSWPKGFFDQDKNDLRELLKLKMEQK